jgi:hypothetical protein
MLALAVSATAFMAGLAGLDPRSDEALESDLSAPLFTALARRSCNRELGRLRDELRGAGSTTSFLSVAAFSAVSVLVVPSVVAGFVVVEPSSASMVSSRDSKPEMALFHQFFPLMLRLQPLYVS